VQRILDKLSREDLIALLGVTARIGHVLVKDALVASRGAAGSTGAAATGATRRCVATPSQSGAAAAIEWRAAAKARRRRRRHRRLQPGGAPCLESQRLRYRQALHRSSAESDNESSEVVVTTRRLTRRSRGRRCRAGVAGNV
jgi:hypothetical protein